MKSLLKQNQLKPRYIDRGYDLYDLTPSVSQRRLAYLNDHVYNPNFDMVQTRKFYANRDYDNVERFAKALMESRNLHSINMFKNYQEASNE